MKLDSLKLQSILVANGKSNEDAEAIANDVYTNNSTVIFRAVLWACAKFGARAVTDTDLIEQEMSKNSLNPFQAVAKLSNPN